MSGSAGVVLSLFGGCGLLDMGFAAAGFTIVRGPDLLWSADIREFDARPLRGMIDGVIGGVPCQHFSVAVKPANREKHLDLWPEYWRVVDEVGARWNMAENVPRSKLAATNLFVVPPGRTPATLKILCDDLGSAQARPRMFLYAGPAAERFAETLKKLGPGWGNEWRLRIGRDIPRQAVRTVTGDGTISRGDCADVYRSVMSEGRTFKYRFRSVTGDSKQHSSGRKREGDYYLQWPELLNAFDLPPGWSLPGHAMISRSNAARIVTQGVPVAAAFAVAMTIRELLGLTGEVAA
jgi:hypothetical protein